MKIKGVVLDLDNTLYEEADYLAAVFGEFSRVHGIASGTITRAFIEKLLFPRKNVLECFLNEYYVYQTRLHDELFELYKNICVRLEMYPDADELIRSVSGRKLKLAVLTNGVIAVQRNKIRNLNIADRFDVIVFAREFGDKFEKPDRRSFAAVSERLGIPPEELMFVGDNPLIDFAGAKEIGGFTVRLKRGPNRSLPSGPFVDKEIAYLKEAAELCGKN